MVKIKNIDVGCCPCTEAMTSGSFSLEKTVKTEAEKRKILIIDSEKDMRYLFYLIIADRYKGYGIIRAKDCQLGIHKFNKYSEELALVITDLNMHSGEDVLNYISGKSDVPVIAMTADEPDKFEEKRLMAAGAAKVFKKTFESTEFYGHVDMYLNVGCF